MLCEIFDSANDVTNLHSSCSEVGVGGERNSSQSIKYFLMPALCVLEVDGASPASK